MTSAVEIVSQEDIGDLIKVRLKVKSSEIFSVEGTKLDTPDRSSDYHQSLHSGRVTHRHNTYTTDETIYISSPFSQDELDAKVAEIVAVVDNTQVSDFDHNNSDVQERMFIGGGNEKLFYKTTQAPSSVISSFTTAFPTENLSTISLISTPSYHNIVDDNVISTFLWEDDTPQLVIDGVKCIARSRKYIVGLQKKYDRCYTFTAGETFSFLPEGCTPLAKSFHTNIDDGLTLPNFYDVYFTGDSTIVEEAFSLPSKVGKETTYYAVTVVEGTVRRAKQYCYDATTAFYDWQATVERSSSNHGVPWI